MKNRIGGGLEFLPKNRKTLEEKSSKLQEEVTQSIILGDYREVNTNVCVSHLVLVPALQEQPRRVLDLPHADLVEVRVGPAREDLLLVPVRLPVAEPALFILKNDLRGRVIVFPAWLRAFASKYRTSRGRSSLLNQDARR